MCDSVWGVVAWLALVIVGKMMMLLLLLLRRAVGMDIHDAGASVRERTWDGRRREVGQWRGPARWYGARPITAGWKW